MTDAIHTDRAVGNLTSDGTTTFAYDSENRLTRATGPKGEEATYTYDPFGRRLSKTVDGATTYFVYDGDQLIGELIKGSLLTATYVYGPGIDEVLRMTRGRTSTYYHADGLGSIAALTDSTGSVIERTTYDAFGTPQLAWPTPSSLTQLSTVGNRFFFTGREYDAETGLIFLRTRYYSAFLGRFLQRDPTGYDDGPNLFTYVGNNPTTYIDPFGTTSIAPMPGGFPGTIDTVPPHPPWPQGDITPQPPSTGPIIDIWPGLHPFPPGDRPGLAPGPTILDGPTKGKGGLQGMGQPGSGILRAKSGNQETTPPTPENPPTDWVPQGKSNTWLDPDTGEIWHWHPDPEGTHGGSHWDIGGPNGTQEWWPLGGGRGPKPPGGAR